MKSFFLSLSSAIGGELRDLNEELQGDKRKGAREMRRKNETLKKVR